MRLSRSSPPKRQKRGLLIFIHREKTTGLSSEETAELEHYLQLEHIMRLAKARARAYLAHE